MVGTNAADGWGGLPLMGEMPGLKSNNDTIRKNSVESLELMMYPNFYPRRYKTLAL